MIHPDWSPFLVSPLGHRADPPRSVTTLAGIGDRLRAAAFAELQAREAFNWAAWNFVNEVSPSVIASWKGLALAEDKHLNWLLKRMEELKIQIPERKVSDQLWISFYSCKTAKDFAFYMASAEERGQKAGERFYEAMREIDPISAELFRQIAKEEVEHIQLAKKYFDYPAIAV